MITAKIKSALVITTRPTPKEVAEQAYNAATELLRLSDMLRSTRYRGLANEAYIVAYGLMRIAEELEQESNHE